MNREDIDRFEKLTGQLISVYEEISLLSKKSPGDALNSFKLNFINKLLLQSNDFLSKENRPFEDFEKFEDDSLPQNSDTVFILGQYIECFEKVRSDNVSLRNGSWFWVLEDPEAEGGKSYLRTNKPKRLRE
jgi:hypothetical protein